MNKIITSFLNPPIPVRCMDWQATREGYEGGDAIGNGETELAAITDLLEQEALLITRRWQQGCTAR